MEYINIPELKYRDFSRHLHHKKESERVPLGGDIEVTSHCNLNCRHCYIRDNSIKNELTYEECCRIIDEIVKAGCLWLTFTGGEPFLRKDFLDIYTYAKRKGLLIVIFTNGTLITPEIADYLKELKPFYLEISLYGMSRQTYEQVTGSADAYDLCMEAISLFRQRQILFNLKSVLIETNKHDIALMKQFAKCLNVYYRFDFLINPRIDGGKEPCKVRIKPEEAVNIEMADEEVRRETTDSFLELQRLQKSDLLFSCSAGQDSFHIDSLGNLHICNMVRFISYNLRNSSFKQGWNLFSEILLSYKRKTDNKCSVCRFSYFCHNCPGWAMMECGNEEALVEYLCKITHLRVNHILGKEVRGYGDE